MIYLDQIGKDVERTLVLNHPSYVRKFPTLRKRLIDLDQQEYTDEWDAIQAILTLDACYYTLRRMSFIDGVHVDSILQTRRQLINEYELIYGPYYDPNTNVHY